MSLRPLLPRPVRPLLLGRLSRLASVALVAALAGLSGLLACDANPFGPSLEGYVEPMSRLTVEVRATDGAGIAGVPLELRGPANQPDSARVYALASTGADGTVYIGSFSVLFAASYRLFITPPTGFGLAPGQVSPMNFVLTDEASDGPLGSGSYGNPARVVVRLVRLL